jgi:hypothetical protein
MSISYFKKKNGKNLSWEDITREERYFCSELFGCIKGNEKTFVKFLKSKSEKLSKINEKSEWDSGYEVCFYRDFLKIKAGSVDISVKKSEYSQKRTFDLCLFSNECIIIIEAKAQQGFETKQLKSIEEDKKSVKKIIKEIIKEIKNVNIEVKLVSLTSSDYTPKEKTENCFDCNIKWNDLVRLYKEKSSIFQRADNLYKN